MTEAAKQLGMSKQRLAYLVKRGKVPAQVIQRLGLGFRRLEGPVSALQAYHLVLDGRLAEVPVMASGQPKYYWTEISGGRLEPARSAASWSGREKLAWVNGRTARYDVVADPLEQNPLPAGELVDLESAATWPDREVGEVDGELADMLRSLGYAQ